VLGNMVDVVVLAERKTVLSIVLSAKVIGS
jgi:hypothetical protein